MNITDRIKRSVQRRHELVLRPVDFQAFGSEASVKRALKELVDQGLLVRLGVGLYAKAKRSVLSGQPIPARPLEVLGPMALTRLGVTLRESTRIRDYNAGLTTQVPTGIVVNTGRRRITRKIGFNGKFVEYEHGRVKA